jgi:hypothetical protein
MTQTPTHHLLNHLALFEEEFLLCQSDSKDEQEALVRYWTIAKPYIFFGLIDAFTFHTDLRVYQVNYGRVAKQLLRAFGTLWQIWTKKQPLNTKVFCLHVADIRVGEGGSFNNRIFQPFIEKHKAEKLPFLLTCADTNTQMPPQYIDLSALITLFHLWKKTKINKDSSFDKLAARWQTCNKKTGMDYPLFASYFRKQWQYFEAERQVYRWIWRRWKPSIILLSDESFSGRMQAAQDLQIPVFDFQHGQGYRNYYELSPFLVLFKSAITLPNRVMVYGQVFKDLLLANGLWTANEIGLVGYAEIEKARASTIEIKPINGRLQLLIPTQTQHFHTELLNLLECFSALDYTRFQVNIRFHPRESTTTQKAIEAFVAQYPQLFYIVDNKGAIYHAITQNDLVVGFNSTALLESVALGVPTLTIATVECPNGLYNILPIQSLKQAIRITTIGSEVLSKVVRFSENESFRLEWQTHCHQSSYQIFAPLNTSLSL